MKKYRVKWMYDWMLGERLYYPEFRTWGFFWRHSHRWFLSELAAEIFAIEELAKQENYKWKDFLRSLHK